jgi:UDP-N-acetylmuramoylalanine--D-glutamate ligase
MTFEIRDSGFDIPDRVLVVGLGASGTSCVKFLAGRGVRVTATDMKKESELSDTLKTLEEISFTGRFGGHDRKDFLDHPLIVISPGIATDNPLLEEARLHGARVIGEIELASWFIKEPIIAITGTNGKTTTTTVMGQVFKRAFGEDQVFVGGNIGDPLMNYVVKGEKARVVIAEISSFQLETIESFRPQTSILLNITEDHLDRYAAFSDYVRAKMEIFRNQTKDDYALLSTSIKGADTIKARKFYFSTEASLKEGAFLNGDRLCIRLGGEEFDYERAISPLVGIHNSENLLSVILTAHLYGVGKDAIEKTLREFKGLPHRVEFVRAMNGVKFYNDSKATNVDATKRALESMKEKTVLIAGGKDKGGSYDFITPFSEKLRGLVLFGEAKERIEAELGRSMKTFLESTLDDAVHRALSVARAGDVVLFSPMCSSFDMFDNYKARGNMFKQIVEAL